MLKKYYNRVAHRDEDKKKDAGDNGGDDEFPPVENAFVTSRKLPKIIRALKILLRC